MKERMKRTGACLLAAVMVSVMVPDGGFFVRAEERADIGTESLEDFGTEPPEAWGVTPSPNQYRYQKEELAAFCHFGPNTYNEVEWGEHYGDSAPGEIFGLRDDFKADQMIRTLKNAGFKKLIITAKHHDGFCLWNSKWTDYNVAKAGYQDGEGDVLADISAACTKYDMDMGLYLSPWDIHEPSYGYYDAEGNSLCGSNGQPLNNKTWAEVEELDVLNYNDYYNNQLEEILSSEKYGNDGHFVEVWMDGAKGSGANAQNYEFQRWFETIQKYEGREAGFDDDCLLFGAEAFTTVRWIGNELGLANEETWSKSQVDYDENTIESNKSGTNGTTIGIPEGNKWTVPEADSRITSGWFWGNSKKTPKSISDLSHMYFNSVGHNAVLLLNVPPNTDGAIDQAILDRVTEFGDNIKESFERNLAEQAAVTATEVRGNDIRFSPANVLDDNDETYWTMNDGSKTGSLTLDLGGAKRFDMVTIEEAILLGQRIKSFRVEYKLGDGEWQEFASGTTIGAKRICRQEAVRADKVRITITDSYEVPLISEVGVYKASTEFEVPSPVPDGMETILVSDTDVSDGSGFTFTGSWTSESGSQFIGGISKWARSGAKAELKFTGHKVWLFGTVDPSHGTADIYIDGTKVDSINTQASSRATSWIIYESDDLDAGEHTLEIRNTGTIGLNTAAVLNNEQKGIIQFDTKTLTMEEDSVEKVVVRRVGGSRGSLTVTYENNPGSAVQGNYDVDGIGGDIVFADGETEKEISVTTKRDLGVKGNLKFSVDLVNVTGGGLLGFNTKIDVTIRDMDDPARLEEAENLLEECKALNEELYTRSTLRPVQELTLKLDAYINAGDLAEVSDVINVMLQLEEAKNALELREIYSTDDPFVFPVGEEVKTLEAEMFILDAENAANADQYVRVSAKDNASNGKEINWFETGNRIILPFTAAKAGTYKVTATYRSGRDENNPNAFEWSGTNVTPGSQDVYGETNATQYHIQEMNIEITQAGEGELVFTASDKGGPVIDKFVVEPEDKTTDVIAVEGVSLDTEVLNLNEEQKNAFITAVISPNNATSQKVIFESSDPDIVSVNSSGLMALLISGRSGEAVITVKTEDGSKTASCKVIVEKKDVAIKNLTAALTNAGEIQKAGRQYYTKESWDNFLAAYNAASNWKDTASAKELIYLADSLNNAAKNLKEDQTLREQGEQLEKAVADAEKIISAGRPENVSETAWNAFIDAYQKVLAGKNDITESNLKNLLSLLNEAEKAVRGAMPSTPANVRAVSKATGVTITFSQSANASSYEIYRQDGNKAPKKIAAVTGNSYTDEKPLGGKRLTYTVAAISSDASYRSPFSAGASVTLPKAVSKLKAKVTSGGVKISFKKVKGAKKYIVMRALEKNGKYKKVKILKANQTVFTDKKVKKGKYIYKVITQKGMSYSPAAKTKKVTVKK